MVFFILAAFSVLLAIVRVQALRIGDPRAIKGALARFGISYVAFWALGTGVVFGDGAPLGLPVAPEFWAGTFFVLQALLALLLWTALAELSFYRFRRRDLVWIVPFGTLSLLLGVSPGVNQLLASVVAVPALWRMRWRREVSGSTVTTAALVGFAFVLMYFWSRAYWANPEPSSGQAVELLSFTVWIRSLALLYVILALPRLAWGMDVQIASVKRRLLVSHVLAGLVPFVLLFVFWGLSTFLSVNADRAQVAARHVEEEGYELGIHLEAALEDDLEWESALLSWVGLHAHLRPGTRLYVFESDAAESLQEPGSSRNADSSGESDPSAADEFSVGAHSSEGRERLDEVALAAGEEPLSPTAEAVLEREVQGLIPRLPSGWRRVYGDPAKSEGAIALLPSRFDRGIVLLDGESYLASRRTRTNDSGAERLAIALIPADIVLGNEYFRRTDAEVLLDTKNRVESTGLAVQLRADSLSAGDPATSWTWGAAGLPVTEWVGGEWKTETVTLRSRVGFFEAVQGLTRNLQENPYNTIALIFLGVVAFLFVLFEVLTLGMVISMGRSITRALGALAQGTSRLREGNLRYRIPIEGRDDLWDVAESFNRMAITLEEARDTEIEKERLEGELALAHQIQARLLPAEAPSIPRTELAGLSLPAREVGGNYYDFVTMPHGRVGLIVADVSGKGVPAALLMSSFRASLLAQDLNDEPAEILARLNAFLHKSVEPGRFVTAFFGVLDPSSGRFVYSNAGHNPPYLVHSSGEMTTLREGGLVLGLFGESRYEQAEVRLQAGDTLALFTDGVTEAQNVDEELWGDDRFLQILLSHVHSPCRRIVSEVLRELRRFAGDELQSDDITLLLARWHGAPVETEPVAAEAAPASRARNGD